MATVETVTGPIDACELGTTLIHEHLRTRDEAVHEQWPQAEGVGRDPGARDRPGEDYDAAVEAARAALELGVKTIVDPTAMFLGRDVALHAPASPSRPGLQVVAVHRDLHLRPPAPLLRLAATPTRSPTCSSPTSRPGIQGTEVKAAFIKCAADEPGVTENVEKVHRAAARASLRTGAPIMAHSRPASETGAAPDRDLPRGGRRPGEGPDRPHAATPTDLDYIERLLETGVWIGLDRYGLEMYLPYDQRQATTLALLERGYADRIFLSADSCATIDWFPPATSSRCSPPGWRRTGTSGSCPSG